MNQYDKEGVLFWSSKRNKKQVQKWASPVGLSDGLTRNKGLSFLEICTRMLLDSLASTTRIFIG
jgi:hypothetical protein